MSEKKNLFPIFELNLEDVETGRNHEQTLAIMNALKGLPISKDKCIGINKTHFKDAKSAYSGIQHVIKKIRAQKGYEDYAFKIITKKDAEGNWTTTYVWRIA